MRLVRIRTRISWRKGMRYVIVNGVLVRDAGEFTAKLPGKVIVPERR